MRATTWMVPPLLAFFAVLPAAAREPNVELGVRSVATLSVDDETRGGGAGFAAEAALPVRRELIGPSALFVYASAGVLVGAGLAYQAEAGAALRWTRRTSWQPEVRLSLFWLGGDLVRSIDADGRVAEDPIALRLGLAPLRFRLEDGWVTALAVSVGPTLLRGGEPPLSCSLALFEVGTEL